MFVTKCTSVEILRFAQDDKGGGNRLENTRIAGVMERVAEGAEEKRRQAAALQSERWRANKRTAPRLSEAPLTKTKLLGKRVK